MMTTRMWSAKSMKNKTVRVLLGIAISAGLAIPATAQEIPAEDSAAAVAAPEENPNPYRWETKSPETQLEKDVIQIPSGKGALFVPRMSMTSSEQSLIVKKDGKEIDEVEPGMRLVLDPGTYEVVAGEGSSSRPVSVPVEVKAGDTTIVPAKWGMMRVDVMDDSLLPHRGAYEILDAETRETVGSGFGADTRQGEKLQVWTLTPGLYRIVQPGGNYRTRTNFSTVYIPEGGFVRFRIVMDPLDGTFQGAGVVLPGEFGTTEVTGDGFVPQVVLGIDASLNHSLNVVGQPNQMNIAGDLFVEANLGYYKDAHYFSSQIELVEGLSVLKPEDQDFLPIIKTTDKLRVDAMYTYFVTDWFGPYARVAVQTQLFPGDVLTSEDLTVIKKDAAGNVLATENIKANNTYRVSDYFGVTTIEESIGANFRPVDSQFVTMYSRIGPKVKHRLFNNLFTDKDDSATPAKELLKQEDFNQYGVELNVTLTARLTGWVFYNMDFELFEDFELAENPDITWDNTLTFRLLEWLSLNYTASLVREPRIVDETQFQQKVLLRASWAMF